MTLLTDLLAPLLRTGLTFLGRRRLPLIDGQIQLAGLHGPVEGCAIAGASRTSTPVTRSTPTSRKAWCTPRIACGRWSSIGALPVGG